MSRRPPGRARRTSAVATRGSPPPRLDAYAGKRDFRVTPEPAPTLVPSTTGPAGLGRFMVHKHHARRLHYDLRLEMDGVLASWAIPKGPSYDPAVKRLAIETEDHPLAYATFEGRIPEGEYGAGDSLVWDRGTYDTMPPGEASRQRQKGHLELRLAGEKLRGGWRLVRTSRPSPRGARPWLFIKVPDARADPAYDVVAARPESVLTGWATTRGPTPARSRAGPHPAPDRLLDRLHPPMLTTAVDRLPGDLAAWHLEWKYDGFRALAAVSAGRVAVWSRSRLELGARFGPLARALAALPVAEAVLDGEIVVFGPEGAPRFEWLQGGHDAAAVFVAFDLLWLEGEDLRARPVEARRDLLRSVLLAAPPTLRLAERVEAAPDPLAAARRRGIEGLVLKRRGSRYESGRSRLWLKVKVVRTQDVAVVGFTPERGASAAIGALLVGVAESGELRFAGRVGTGFTARERAALFRDLSREAVGAPALAGAPALPEAVWVEPRRVLEVGFTEWTADGLLRHPRFRAWRPDRVPLDCTHEPVAAVTAAPVLVLTHPERVLYPRDGITKQDVARYYETVADPLLRALGDRPLAFEHWSDGIDRPSWFEQGVRRPEPWMRLVETPSRTSGRAVRHLVADRPEVLPWLAQHGVLTIHMWAARVGRLEAPDWVVFDLDPGEPGGLPRAVDAALVLRGLFDRLGLPSVPKTSGQRGLHVLVPLAPGHTHEQARAFARRIGAAVATALPEEVTVERAPGRRRGRLYLDCLQNGYGRTIVAPYSLRARDGAPVSAPLRWEEVTPRLDPGRLSLRTLPRRLDRVGDLFRPALEAGVRLPPIE